MPAANPGHKQNPAPAAIVIGGGPAGLRAAEVLSGYGATVHLFDHKPSVGRKFLVAGRGGLNLTHSEPLEAFVERYGDHRERWSDLLSAFGPADLRAWVAELGIETYVGSSGRVFPKGQQAAALLRRWLSRLRKNGVEFHVGQHWTGLESAPDGGRWSVSFRDAQTGAATTFVAPAVLLALGGASWPQTGSDGEWPRMLAAQGVAIEPWQPANAGWDVAWDPRVLAAAEGLPLKNIALSAAGRTVRGEAMITHYGLEGGAIYQLGRELRAMSVPSVQFNLKSDLNSVALRQRLGDREGIDIADVCQRLKLNAAASALLEFQTNGAPLPADSAGWIERIQALPIDLIGPRPIAEAISSAGGIRWSELDEGLMISRLPRIFAAGEMIDWEAPTGGYLLQGCLATGTRAGESAWRWLAQQSDSYVGQSR